MDVEEEFMETIVQPKEIIKTLQDNLSKKSNFRRTKA